MRLLLIAYEFPPSPSPQSLRWTYLVRELAALGHEVHILAPDLGGETPGLPALPSRVVVHRTFAGPFRGMLSLLRKRWQRRQAERDARGELPAAPEEPTSHRMVALRPPRNWKQRISESVQALAAYVLFPDIRGEWKPFAAHRLKHLLRQVNPDVVISSHEPATTLQLGLIAKRAGYRWLADLGDPVLATYTPWRWRGISRRIEAATCRKADLLTLTNAGAAALLRERHGELAPTEILSQGFDAAPTLTTQRDAFDPARLELLYTGSLYAFRRVDMLLDALAANPGVRLSIAAVTVPEAILAAANAAPESIRLLGFLPHAQALGLQREADVLVSIANDDMVQVPGKFYEYLGAARPILHLGDAGDPVARVIDHLHRGWTVPNTTGAIERRLHAVAAAKAQGRLHAGLDLSVDAVGNHSWQALGKRLELYLHDLIAR